MNPSCDLCGGDRDVKRITYGVIDINVQMCLYCQHDLMSRLADDLVTAGRAPEALDGYRKWCTVNDLPESPLVIDRARQAMGL